MKVCVVGASRGIGLEVCRQLAARGDEVIAVCRTAPPALEALGCRVEQGVDVTLDTDVDGLARRLEGERIDVLLHVSGVLANESLSDLDFDRIRRQFEVNTLGPLRVVARLRDHLGEGSKVGIVSSRMGSIGDNTSGGRYGYRISKAGANMAAMSLAQDLKPHGVAVAILHPGFVRTEMTGGQGFIDVDESARGLIARLDELELDSTGTFWHANGEVLPW